MVFRNGRNSCKEAVHLRCCRQLLLVGILISILFWSLVVISRRCSSQYQFRLFCCVPPVERHSTVLHLTTWSDIVRDLRVSVTVRTNRVIQFTDPRFASVAIDASLIEKKFKHFDTSSVKLLTLAKALSPSFLRFGGTAEDLLIFDNTGDQINNEIVNTETVSNKNSLVPGVNFTMTASDWDKINKFATAAGWQLVFGLNILLRNGSAWDPTNALMLMRYSQSRGYNVHLELGNEPNAFKHVFGRTVDPGEAGQDFGSLRGLMNSLRAFKSSLLIGPDVTKPIKLKAEVDLTLSSKDYLKRFLETGIHYLDVVSFHHYYVRSQTTTQEDFTSASILDSLREDITAVETIINSTAESKPIWLGEAGSASGGGAAGLSNRYIAGFMYLDRLGLSAANGVKVVIRQSFFGGDYAMIDHDDYTPFPDFWLSLLFKTLVGERVLQVEANSTSNQLRLYAHCTRTGGRSHYKPGAVTVYILNLCSTDVEVTFHQYQESDLHLYLLTPGPEGLTSRDVQLNGQVLKMTNESQLPLLQPKIQSGELPVTVKTLSFGFVVIPEAKVMLCT